MRPAAAFRAACAALLLTLSSIGSAFAFVVVGPGCTFSDLQSAIDSKAADEIHVVVSYQVKPIKFQNRALQIYGAYTDCTGLALAPFNGAVPPFSFLDGSLDSAKPVIDISGASSLDLHNFRVINGHNFGAGSSGSGGGIRFVSSGSSNHLTLQDVDVAANQADFGGGIFYDGGASVSDNLTLLDHVFIEGNSANTAGGGIRLQGHVFMFAQSPETSINDNTANPFNTNDGKGGGLQILNISSAFITSPGNAGAAVINHNHARYGGGVSVHDSGVLILRAAQASRPVRIENNDAALFGGGIYLSPQGFNSVCGFGYGINHNTATDGSAIYRDASDGGTNQGRVDLAQDCPQPAPVCPVGEPCNSIDDNQSKGPDAGIVTVDGNTDSVEGLSLERVEMRRNSSAHLISVRGGQQLDLRNCLLAQNNLLAALIKSSAPVVVHSCTAADNTIGGNSLMALTGSALLAGSIFDQPGTPLLASSSKSIGLVDLITPDADNLNAQAAQLQFATRLLAADPFFIDPANGDYHLQANSPAIDYTGSGMALDLDGHPRGVILRNVGTPFDIGAFEKQTLTPVTFPPVETFEELDPDAPALPFGWFNTVTNDTGTSTGWAIATDFAFDGTHSVHVADAEGITDSTLDTPTLFVSRDGQLSFYHRFVLDFFDNRAGGGGITFFDGAVLEVSVDGQPFVDILDAGGSFVSGGYNATISTDWSSPIAGRKAWSGNSSGWQKVVVNLPPAANDGSVTLRWRVASDQANSAPGYWLDDIDAVIDTIFKDGF